MIRRPPRSTLFPTRRSSDLDHIDAALRHAVRQLLDRDRLGDRHLADELLLRLGLAVAGQALHRSEEHTSELQSRQYLVCRLLLEKKKYHHLDTRYVQITYSP